MIILSLFIVKWPSLLKKNQSIVRKSDLVVSFWALHYTLSAEFADKDETSHKFDARNPDVALVNCMDKLANLFDGVPPKSKFIFFHFDPFSEEQKISLECWEKIVPLPFGKQTASLYVLKKFFEERSDIDSKIEKIGGISPMQTLDRALETYMNFHLHTLFNHSEYRTEVMELLIRRLEKYSKTNFNIPAGTIIFSGEKAAHTRNTHHIGVTAVSDYVQVIEKLLRTHLDGVFTPELKFEEVASTFDKNVYLLSLIKKPKWRDDALIFKIDSKDKKTNPYVVKIHEDKYPLASHIYNDVALIDKISGSGHAAKIIKTFSIVNADIKFRVVIYDYLNGSSLASLLQNATEQQILELRRELKHCVGGLLKLGVNVFVRDLSDFHVISNKKDGILKIVLTDFNAILDCSNSDEYSRVRIMDIIDSIIDKLVSPDYKPFNSHRPMMIDLRF